MAASSSSPPSPQASPEGNSGSEEFADMLRSFMESLTGFSEHLPFTIDRQRLRSITALFALVASIIFVWKLLRGPTEHERRRRRATRPPPSGSDATSHTSTLAQSNEVSTSTGGSSVQDIVHDLFKPVNVTLGQLVRQRFCEGRKVTCRLLGVILVETTPEELQKHATVRPSVLEVLLELAEYCDLYLMERILDDESGERIMSSLNDAKIFKSGGLISDKVLFCSTENGRISFVRQIEPDWHIDTNSEIISQLARFIKYQLHISPSRSERIASNVFSSINLEQFIGVPDQS
ncbi:LOW QUALITY PROTEIN: peroxisome biogenesis protein 22-like [Dioscorea cayenensis subsp. rotundata]|uniref:LOW QUALITY PROTEIN: peroxisome biogenesis protein 22-like n=1 Tax=Dioscorea cayennensis subsp. rotundata TaxID=55577 RepID=A0AB40BUE1_DIOCR|nr:LOW QUALITY PROTEIN: peroxisome biogenesis protein 22-like [Dioscorea cayenensis subsp. rotundata]